MVRTCRQPQIAMRGWLDQPVALDEPQREGAVRILLRAYKTTPTQDTERFLEDLARHSGAGRYPRQQAASHWMTWDMLRQMQASGMTIAKHTVSHPVLTQASPEQQEQEILGCGQRLQAELGQPMLYFSYPVGGHQAFDQATPQAGRRALRLQLLRGLQHL